MARLRIKDIAELAGVSPATVSRYLNGREGTMSEATRARVAAVVEQTGYRPSNAARSLRTERTGSLGVILADLRNPYSAAMLEALDAQAAERGLTLMTATSGNDAERETTAIERLVTAGVDGLVVNTCAEDSTALAQAATHVPVVLLDRDIPHCELPLVTSNNKALMAGIVGELAQAGCVRCHMLDEHNATSLTRLERARAFEAELTARSMQGGVVALDVDATRAAAQLAGLADEGSGPVGIVAVNGLVFLRVVEALGSASTSTLGQLRLATFDEYAWNRILLGGVTTAMQDTEAIARAALDLVTQGDGHAQAPRRVEIPGRIIARASTR